MTDYEKRQAITELWYELMMFNTMGILILKDIEDYKMTEKNAFYESFLTHTRNIVYFLEDKKYEPKDGSGKDIVCSDFNVQKKLVNLPKGYNVHQINKFTQHLTMDRIKLTSPKWRKKTPEILEKVNKCFRNFIDQLSPGIFPEKIDKNKFEQVFNYTKMCPKSVKKI